MDFVLNNSRFIGTILFVSSILMFIASWFFWRWEFRKTFGFWPTKNGPAHQIEQVIIDQEIHKRTKCFLELSQKIYVAERDLTSLLANPETLGTLDTKTLLIRRNDVVGANKKREQTRLKAETAKSHLLDAWHLAKRGKYSVFDTPRCYLDPTESKEPYARLEEASLYLCKS